MSKSFMQAPRTKTRCKLPSQHAGFSILEMLIASAIMMVGIISVMQLVPVSIQLNSNNRLDTLSTVIAQRELDQMLSQPLSVNVFKDKDGQNISLGGAGSPGAAVIMDPQGYTQIDFTAPQVPGFFIPAYKDINDPTGATFELRWAVIPQVINVNGRTVTISKRIILGVRQTNANHLVLPVALDSWVHK